MGLSHAIPASDLSLTQVTGGDAVMILAVQSGVIYDIGQVIAVNLHGTPSLYWSSAIPLGTGVHYNGQFPHLHGPDNFESRSLFSPRIQIARPFMSSGAGRTLVLGF